MRSPAMENDLRSAFATAMSEMYRDEVPAYGALIELVEDINAEVIARDEKLEARLVATDGLARINDERHGAIRLGSADELRLATRFFAALGMQPVDYYDLGPAGIPVQSTAFRPTDGSALAANPFRMFTSLLNLDAIERPDLREIAEDLLGNRQIFSDDAVRLLELAESEEGLSPAEAEEFVGALVETFKWHSEANVGLQLYEQLHDEHRLIADIVSFKGPHINHLTPRTLDIDVAHATMSKRGIDPKETIEGPPKRKCPILLRQTSFKALSESVSFPSPDGALRPGSHTARFGEIEQRGAALTPAGRNRYDVCLKKSQALASEGGSASAALSMAFAAFPDTYEQLRTQSLAYFEYQATEELPKGSTKADLERLLQEGFVRADPIIYEDFLPVSAAGIFRSNLGDEQVKSSATKSKAEFMENLGRDVIDPHALYQRQQAESMDALFQ